MGIEDKTYSGYESSELLAASGNAAAIIAATRDQARPVMISINSKPHEVAILPSGLQLHSLKRFEDERRTQPERREGTAELTTIASFCDHVVRFADEDSAVFACDHLEAPELVAVLDYHQRTADGQPRFGAHRSKYRFPVSDEWKAWTGIDGVPMSMGDLADHLESWLDDILSPTAVGETVTDFADRHGIALASAARLQELARGLSVRIDRRVDNHQNPSTGEARIHFEESHTDEYDNELKVPGGFALGIPVFRGGDLFQVAARLRYRVSKGAIVWTVALHRTDRVFDVAFEDACRLVEQATSLPVFHGKPES